LTHSVSNFAIKEKELMPFLFVRFFLGLNAIVCEIGKMLGLNQLLKKSLQHTVTRLGKHFLVWNGVLHVNLCAALSFGGLRTNRC
jgi:hypothetical protein